MRTPVQSVTRVQVVLGQPGRQLVAGRCPLGHVLTVEVSQPVRQQGQQASRRAAMLLRGPVRLADSSGAARTRVKLLKMGGPGRSFKRPWCRFAVLDAPAPGPIGALTWTNHDQHLDPSSFVATGAKKALWTKNQHAARRLACWPCWRTGWLTSTVSTWPSGQRPATSATRLPEDYLHPGDGLYRRTHWLFPVLAPDPDRLVAELRRQGMDVSTGTSNLVVVAAAQRRAARAGGPADGLDRLPAELSPARPCGTGQADRRPASGGWNGP